MPCNDRRCVRMFTQAPPGLKADELVLAMGEGAAIGGNGTAE